MGIEIYLGDSTLMRGVDGVVNWSRRSSIWPVTMGLACCAIEMMVSAGSWDMGRFGSEIFRPTPRQADLMIVSGTVTKKMASVVKRIWEQMPEPKWVIAYGACACSGGIFRTYSVVQGVDQILPVDVYVPGCPPRPEALQLALMDIQAKIGRDSLLDRRDVKSDLDNPSSSLLTGP
jgi:NADH-quinone oxidoreductase subunit B